MSASVTATSASVTAADAAACSSRSFEVQLLARRMEACAEQVDAVQARLSQLQLMDWQSPAALAYRSNLRGQAVALGRAREGVLAASLALRRHSVHVAESVLPAAGGD
jgi:predicted outer membrane protein